jgi:hypothetical protein
MKSKDVFKYFRSSPDSSGKMETAEALGITHQAVYQWGEDVPARSQLLVELLTNGKLKAKKEKK